MANRDMGTRTIFRDSGSDVRSTFASKPRMLQNRPTHWPRQSALDSAGAADLLLQQHDPVEQRLRGRRAAGNVDGNRHEAVATPHDRIGIMKVTTSNGSGAHGYPGGRL